MDIGFIGMAFLLAILLDQLGKQDKMEDHLIFGLSYAFVVLLLTMFIPMFNGASMSAVFGGFLDSIVTGGVAAVMYFVGLIPSKLAKSF